MNQLTIRWTLSAGVPGFAAALPNGRWAALRNNAVIMTESGQIPQPPGGPLMYLDLAPNGRILGQTHATDTVMEWDGRVWAPLGVAWGPNAAVYRHDSTPAVIASQAQWQATGGWRYCATDGTLVPATNPVDASYASPPLYAFTRWPDVAIGQGGKDIGQGCVVQFADDGILRRLAVKDLRPTGDLRFVVAKRDGDQFAIAVVDLNQLLTTLTWLTLAELRAMPPVSANAPPVDSPQPPEVPPVSLPDPTAVSTALVREREKYPARVTNDQSARIVNDAALRFPHCGTHRKSGDNVGTLPNGVTVNRNVMRYLPPGDEFGWWADVLGAAGVGVSTPLSPDWQRSTDGRESFVPATAFSEQPSTDPPPTNPPPSNLEPRLLALEQSVARLADALAALTFRVDDLPQPSDGVTEPRARQLIVQELEAATIVGSTDASGSWVARHAHGGGGLRIKPRSA